MMPMAMILIGCIMANFHIPELLLDKRVYLVSLIRMVAAPAIVLGIGRLLQLSQELMIMLAAVYTMPVGANGVIVPVSMGRDSRLGAGITFVTNVIGFVSIPVFYAFPLKNVFWQRHLSLPENT